MSEIRSMLDWINGKLDTVKEMISKLKYMAKGTIQNETWWEEKGITKWKEHQWAMGQLKADQYMCNWSLQRRRERKGDRKNIQGYSGQKFSIVDTNYKSICIGNWTILSTGKVKKIAPMSI